MLQQRKMTLLLCLLVVLFIPLALGVQAKKAFTTDNLIRFHVVANSDQEQDQHLKYIVRDCLIEALKPQLSEAETCQEARKIIADHRPSWLQSPKRQWLPPVIPMGCV